MIKKIISIFISIVILLTCFAGCSNDEDKYFSCAISTMPEHFDPQIADSQGERIVAVNTFDGLFKLDENGAPQKCAVSDYNISADGRVYTFYLNKDMKYYISKSVQSFLDEKEATIDGKVTAQDFAFGMKRAILPETNAPGYELINSIKNAENVHNGLASAESLGIRVVDDYTLEITLEREDENFIYALSQPVSYPCDEEFFSLTNGRYGLEKKYIISNGAFYLSDIVEKESVRISKNEEYKGNFEASPLSVRLYVNVNQEDVVKKINNKTYTVGFLTNKTAIEKLNKKAVQTSLNNITVSLVFNMSKTTIQNHSLRTGLVEGIDLNTVTTTPSKVLVPPHFKLSVDSVDGLPSNVNDARAKMKKALNELDTDNITINILCMKEYEEMAKAIVSCWQKNIGVELNGTITVAESTDFTSKIRSGDFDAAIYPLSVNSAHSVDFLAMLTTDNRGNFMCYSSEEYDRLVQDFNSYPSAEKCGNCQSYLLKNAIVMPISAEDTVFARAKNTTGVYFCGDVSNVYFYKGQKK